MHAKKIIPGRTQVFMSKLLTCVTATKYNMQHQTISKLQTKCYVCVHERLKYKENRPGEIPLRDGLSVGNRFLSLCLSVSLPVSLSLFLCLSYCNN
jgi:hypothetical protein